MTFYVGFICPCFSLITARTAIVLNGFIAFLLQIPKAQHALQVPTGPNKDHPTHVNLTHFIEDNL